MYAYIWSSYFCYFCHVGKRKFRKHVLYNKISENTRYIYCISVFKGKKLFRRHNIVETILLLLQEAWVDGMVSPIFKTIMQNSKGLLKAL